MWVVKEWMVYKNSKFQENEFYYNGKILWRLYRVRIIFENICACERYMQTCADKWVIPVEIYLHIEGVLEVLIVFHRIIPVILFRFSMCTIHVFYIYYITRHTIIICRKLPKNLMLYSEKLYFRICASFCVKRFF